MQHLGQIDQKAILNTNMVEPAQRYGSLVLWLVWYVVVRPDDVELQAFLYA